MQELTKKTLFHQNIHTFQNTVDPFTYALIMGDQEDESYLQWYYQYAKILFSAEQSTTYQRQAENR